MKAKLIVAAVAMMLLSACGKITPAADHHQHLMSPASAAVYSPPPLPAVKLPEDLALLLKQRAERVKDVAALKQLYTPDAWVLRYSMPGWGRGEENLGSLETVFYGHDKLTPVFFRTNGSTSSIGGYYTRSKDERHLGYFHITVDKTPGGQLLITSEAPSFPIPPVQKAIFADDLIARLDEAGIQRAVVLSNAYFFDGLVPVGKGDRY